MKRINGEWRVETIVRNRAIRSGEKKRARLLAEIAAIESTLSSDVKKRAGIDG